jgi:hypothetical protein
MLNCISAAEHASKISFDIVDIITTSFSFCSYSALECFE